jgi:DNA helicase-2/ATP-dependent DNA helicase PcrA
MDRPITRPIHGRERTAPTGRPVPAPSSAPPPPPPQRKNLKRITGDGAPLEATSTLGSAAPDLAEGMTVEHEKFGKGKVIKIEGRTPDLKATIFFPSAGQKQLLLRFAKLRVVEG